MEREGHGWIVYSGIMLIVVGVLDIFNAIWAFDADSRVDEIDAARDLVVFDSNLQAWGWFYLIVGILLIAAGIAVFSYKQWARWVGMIGASLAIIVNFFWISAFPFQALVVILLAALVLYGLAKYGDVEEPATV